MIKFRVVYPNDDGPVFIRETRPTYREECAWLGNHNIYRDDHGWDEPVFVVRPGDLSIDELLRITKEMGVPTCLIHRSSWHLWRPFAKSCN